jgi:hypothetical protein
MPGRFVPSLDRIILKSETEPVLLILDALIPGADDTPDGIHGRVTVSVGTATVVPEKNIQPVELIARLSSR